MASTADHVVRGASVGALSTIATAAAHSIGAGALPSEAGSFLLVVICSAVGWAAASRPTLSRIRLMAALAAAQVLGHLVLSALETHAHGGTLDGRMLWAHGVAVVGGAQLIAAAERGVRWAGSTLGRAVPRPGPVPIDRMLCVPRTVYRVAGAPQLVDLSGTGTRGPPFAG